MVSHHIGYILDTDLACRLDPERHIIGRVVAHRIIHIVVGVLLHEAAAILIGELALAENVESAPDPGLAAPEPAEIERAIGIPEAEFLILSVEPAHLPCKAGYILGIETVVRIVKRERRDAGLVGMAADISVRNAASHPYGALLGALSHHFHYPGLLLVCNGE